MLLARGLLLQPGGIIKQPAPMTKEIGIAGLELVLSRVMRDNY